MIVVYGTISMENNKSIKEPNDNRTISDHFES